MEPRSYDRSFGRIGESQCCNFSVAHSLSCMDVRIWVPTVHAAACKDQHLSIDSSAAHPLKEVGKASSCFLPSETHSLEVRHLSPEMRKCLTLRCASNRDVSKWRASAAFSGCTVNMRLPKNKREIEREREGDLPREVMRTASKQARE